MSEGQRVKLSDEESHVLINMYHCNTAEKVVYSDWCDQNRRQMIRLTGLGYVEHLPWQGGQHFNEYQLTPIGLLEAQECIRERIKQLQNQIKVFEEMIAD
ncbi:hypothetical protein G4Y79_15210 [Phototrophicus methaneseepsis]|uniref:Transcriptional regulator n=1 Tax=Phototrophicus methaneseepsis TaxID=2710758 RepID=A0A7S8E633_9CHLR|nr:hypothetical protein [Phototrophicus methaneseepsis]QPC81051.1 hypothetical protein G4Y79_15210 [Phototrophicus methaneseepsis]